MKRSLPFVLGGLGVALLWWCCAAVAGVVWLVAGPTPTPRALGPIPEEPAPTGIERRAPTAAERETAATIAAASVPPRDLVDLAVRFRGLPPTFTVELPTTPPTWEIGDSQTFWVRNLEDNTSFRATATLRYATAHAYWWIEQGYAVPDDDLELSARNFETRTYPTNRSIFGSEWTPGIDGDPHVYIFLGNVPGVSGYFSTPDEYPRPVRDESNEHEMFYVNLESAVPGTDYFDGTLAHEFQHMIHWMVDRDEDTWVNEGLAELAAHVNGYSVGSTDLAFTAMPDTQLTAWSDLDVSAPHYGASYMFMAYLLDEYGPQTISRLVQEQANGIAGIDNVLAAVDPGGRSFVEVFDDWVAANYLSEQHPADKRLSYDNLDVSPPVPAIEHDRFPAAGEAAVHQFAADYIVLHGSGPLTIDFSGSTVVSLVGNNTRSGDYQWWSQRADEADATLTRAFDLTGLRTATLEAWLWYDLEAGYDYAYVMASSDAGATWTILENGDTTVADPSGSSYGPGLTGTSGASPGWVLERFDLSPFAGRPILVRFEVITDEELNKRGLCLDGVSIPELGYSDDAEDGDGGWQAEGFVRVADRVPQQFVVQVLLPGDEPRVERLVLDDASQGMLTVERQGSDRGRAIVLIVSGVTTDTTEPASYRYRVTTP